MDGDEYAFTGAASQSIITNASIKIGYWTSVGHD